MRKLAVIAAMAVMTVTGFAEDMRIWNGGAPVGTAAWYLRDSTPLRLIKGNGPVGPAFVEYRDGKIFDGDAPGKQLWLYQGGKLWKGNMPVGRPACEFRDNKLIVNAIQTVGVFTPHNKRFFKGNTPVGNPAFTWKGNWPEGMLVYVAYRQYVMKGNGPQPAVQTAQPAAPVNPGEIPEEEIFRVKDGNNKVVCCYALRQIWNGDTPKGEPAWNFDGTSFRKGTDKTGVPVATFKGRYLLKGDGSNPSQYLMEFLMMCEYEPGKAKPDAFGNWDSTNFDFFYKGFRTYQQMPQGTPLLRFERKSKSHINTPTKHFIVWKYLMDK